MISSRTLVILIVGGIWLSCLGGCYPSGEVLEVSEVGPDPIDVTKNQPATPKIAWESASDCRGKLRLLQQGLHSGQIETFQGSPFLLISDQRFASLDRWSGGRQQVSLTMSADNGDQDLRCVIRLGETQAHKAEHRVLGQEQVRSSYQSGTHREKNPAYDAAQARLRQAERANKPKKSSLISVGDPLIDLIGTLVGGAVTGVEQWGQGDPVEEAIEALVATPRSIEHPKYRSYSFERTKIRASREAVIPITMTDRQLQKSWRTSMKRRELKELIVLDGLDRQDRDYAEHRKNSMTDQQFRQWQNEPPEIPLPDMIVSLLGAETALSVDRVASLGDFNERPSTLYDENMLDAAATPSVSTAKPEIRAQRSKRLPVSAALDQLRKPVHSLVTIAGGDHRGEGVYVTADFVLTGSELVEGHGLVDVTFRDGGSVLGLVVKVDRGRGLALIQVARPGAPVVFEADHAYQANRFYERRSYGAERGDDGDVLDDGVSEYSGAGDIRQESGPILHGRRLVGFRSRRGPDISMTDIKAFLDEQAGVFLSRR